MRHGVAILIGAVVGLGSVSAVAQRANRQASLSPDTAPHTERTVPFRVGETLRYDVSWSPFLTAGTIVITVREKKPSYDSTAYYIVAEGRLTPFFSRLHKLYYKMDTLVDSYTLLSQRGSIYLEEGSQRRFRVTQFDRLSKMAFIEYRSETTAKSELAVPAGVQDALSALYELRVVPLKAGEHLIIPVSDSGRNYSLRIDVTAREQLKTPLGQLGVWRLQPAVYDATDHTIGKNLIVWLSDDQRRLPVRMQGDLPLGKFVLSLNAVR